MNTAIASTRIHRSEVAGIHAARRTAAASSAESTLTSATVEGAFSLLADGSIRIGAEAGLVIRVHAGCLWVPHHEEHCSVGVGAGEQFVVNQEGSLTVLASRGAQVELQWPSRNRSTVGLH